MKYYFNFFIGLVISVISLSCTSRVADGSYRIDVYVTNDIHGYYFDSAYVDNRVNSSSLANISGYLKEVRAKGDNVVLIDNGDILQGDNAAYYFNVHANHALPHFFSEVFGYMNYDAAVLGNHDIEAGPLVYNKIKRELGNRCYLAANAIDVKSGTPYFSPYIVVEREGVRIAILGMTNPAIPKWLSEELWWGMEFMEISDVAQHWIDIIKRREKPHLILLAVHAGLGSDDYRENDMENPARYLAHTLKGVDVVFAAHDHRRTVEYIPNLHGDSVLVIEGGSRASHLSAVKFDIEMKSNKVVAKSINGELIPMAGRIPDEDYLHRFRSQYLEVKGFTNRSIGELDREVIVADALKGPSDYMTILHGINFQVTDADISFAAPLSSRGEIRKGDIIYNDLFTLYPFENQIFVMEMTGQEVKNYLEYSYGNWVNRRGPSYNWDSAAGLIYTVDREGESGNIVNIESLADGTPLLADKRYWVAMTSYRANGGGDLVTEGAGISKDMIENRILQRTRDVRELLFDYSMNNGGISVEKFSQDPKIGHWKFVN